MVGAGAGVAAAGSGGVAANLAGAGGAGFAGKGGAGLAAVGTDGVTGRTGAGTVGVAGRRFAAGTGGGVVRGTKAGGGVTGTGTAGTAGSPEPFGNGMGAGLAGPVEKLTPSALVPNGPVISSATSTFCEDRRVSMDGLSCARITFNGSVTGRGSFSPPEFINRPGTACRSSPKVILTAPCASCDRTLSSGTEKVASGGGGWMIFARSSIGRAAMTG